MNLAKTLWIATSKVFYEEKFWSLFHIWPLWSLANTKNDDERSWISCSMPYHWHLQYYIENKMDLSQLIPKEKRVFNNIPNLCFELREIENAKLRTLFCQKVQDLDRALFCEMVNTREGAERKTRIELLLLKTTSLSSGRGILAKSSMINLVNGHRNQRQLPKNEFWKTMSMNSSVPSAIAKKALMNIQSEDLHLKCSRWLLAYQTDGLFG